VNVSASFYTERQSKVFDCCADRSPGDISDDDDVRDYQDYSSNDDLSDIDASDERPAHLGKLHATRLNFSSQVCCPVLPCRSKFTQYVARLRFMTKLIYHTVSRIC